LTTFSYAQLEGLWEEAGGPAGEASLAAAIAEAESGGNPLAAYPGTTVAPGKGSTTDATGLWQILGLPAGNFTAAELTDPYENAKMAVAKYTQAGNSFSPWQTYDEGDYAVQNIAPTSKGIPTGPGAASVGAGGSGGSGVSTTSIPGDIISGILGQILPGVSGFQEIEGLVNPNNWVDWLERGALMLFGGILIIIGLYRLTGGGASSESKSEENQVTAAAPPQAAEAEEAAPVAEEAAVAA
jgi:hypothetical protein